MFYRFMRDSSIICPNMFAHIRTLLLILRDRATGRQLPSEEAPLSPTSAFNRRDSTVCYTSCRPIVVTTSFSSLSSPRMLIIRSLIVYFAQWKAASLFRRELARGARVEREEIRKEKADERRFVSPFSVSLIQMKRTCRDKNGRSFR